MGALDGARQRPEVRRLLDAARIAVDMDASLLTVHEDDVEVVLASSSRTGLGRDVVGRRTPLPDTCCGQVLAGRMAPWVPDARTDPVAAGLVLPRSAGIGSYVGTPLRRAGGAVAGMLCCISRAPDDRVGPASVALLEGLALALAAELGLHARPDGSAEGSGGAPAPCPAAAPAVPAARRPAPVSGVDHHRAVLALSRGEGLALDFEPVVELAHGRPRAWAARCRTLDPALGEPADAVAAAGPHGLALEVELACLRAALAHQGRQPRGTALQVTVTAALLRRPGVLPLVLEHVPGGLWVRLDHGGASADAALLEAARRLRGAGAVLVVDGAGAPSANLVDALRLRPQLVAVGAGAVDGLAGAGVRPELVGALLAVTRSVGARLVAHDVATAAQRAQLRDLGVPLGHGPAVGAAGPLPPA